MSNQVEQTADRVRSADDPYVKGWEEGKKFAEDRARNLARLDADSQPFLSCKIDRKVWRAANAIWQADTKNPSVYMNPEQLLVWIGFRINELKTFNTQAKDEGFLKGFLAGRGINVKTGQL